jgi:hypothetical protein
MSKSEEYRENARKSQQMAERATNPELRETWLEIATRWLEMFRQRKRLEADDFGDNTDGMLRG